MGDLNGPCRDHSGGAHLNRGIMTVQPAHSHHLSPLRSAKLKQLKDTLSLLIRCTIMKNCQDNQHFPGSGHPIHSLAASQGLTPQSLYHCTVCLQRIRAKAIVSSIRLPKSLVTMYADIFNLHMNECLEQSYCVKEQETGRNSDLLQSGNWVSAAHFIPPGIKECGSLYFTTHCLSTGNRKDTPHGNEFTCVRNSEDKKENDSTSGKKVVWIMVTLDPFLPTIL